MHSVLSHNEARGGPSQLISEWIPGLSEPSTLSQNIKYKYLSVCGAVLRNGHKVAP